MRRFGFAAVLAGLFAAAATGQEAVTIKIAKPKAGDRVRVTKTEKTTAKSSFTAGGKAQAKDETTTKTIVYVDEVITPNDKGDKPLKLTRTYEKYDVSKGGKGEAGPPLNTPITIEKKGDKYAFGSAKDLDKGFAAQLTAEFDKAGPGAETFLPGKPVKPGDTWKLDGDKMKALLGGGQDLGVIDAEKSAVTGKLIKTYLKDGKQFGVLEFTGNVAIKGLGEKVPLTVKPGSGLDIKMTMDGCIDGTSPGGDMKGTLKIKLDAEGGGISMGINADGTITETQEVLKK